MHPLIYLNGPLLALVFFSGLHCRGRASSAAGAKKLLYQGRWEIRWEYAPHCWNMGFEADRNQ